MVRGVVHSGNGPTFEPGSRVVTHMAELHRLADIAHGRSGDKGNHANIGVLAYTPAGFAWLREHLTAEAVRDYFKALGPARVVRYEAPNVLALNFVLYDVLAG